MMKLFCLFSCLTLISVFSNVHGQQNVHAVPASTAQHESSTIKTEATNPVGVSDRVMKSFKRQQKDISEITWNVFTNIVAVNFVKDGLKMKCHYNHSGKLLETYTYYTPDQVPKTVVNLVRRNQYIMPITHAVQIKTNNSTVYSVQMETNEKYYSVLVQEGQVIDDQIIRKLKS